LLLFALSRLPSFAIAVVLRAGPDGAAKVIAKGRGGAIGVPRLPLTALPLRVQLVNAAGQCWEATYSSFCRTRVAGSGCENVKPVPLARQHGRPRQVPPAGADDRETSPPAS
jgi:hypothetical protein